MPQIDFTIFFVLSGWIFSVFFSGYFYSLVYLMPIFVLWSRILFFLYDMAFFEVLVFKALKDVLSEKK